MKAIKDANVTVLSKTILKTLDTILQMLSFLGRSTWGLHGNCFKTEVSLSTAEATNPNVCPNQAALELFQTNNKILTFPKIPKTELLLRIKFI